MRRGTAYLHKNLSHQVLVLSQDLGIVDQAGNGQLINKHIAPKCRTLNNLKSDLETALFSLARRVMCMLNMNVCAEN